MSPTGHLAMGFAAKGLGPKVPLLALLVASYTIDLLYFLFAFLGVDTMAYAPWSHSLMMALIWSFLGALIAYTFSQKWSAGFVIGLTVLSHWGLDFLVWKNNLLTFDPSVTVGLGFYDMIGFSLTNAGWNRSSIIATSIEGLMLIFGIVIYILTLVKLRKAKHGIVVE